MKKVNKLNAEKEAMPVIVIPVSSKSIKNAIQADSHRCMIADAIKKRIPKAQFISVDLQSIRFTDPETKTRYHYFTPLPGQTSLVKFDQGKPVKPFSLTLKDGVKKTAGLHTKRSKIKFGTGRKRDPNRKQKTYVKKERKFGLRNLE